MQLNDLYNTIPAFLVVGVFVYSLFGSLHKIKSLEKQKWYKYISALGPPLIGALMGFELPFFFPDSVPSNARAVLGAIAGLNSGIIVGLIRRYLKATKEKGKGLPAVIEAAASIVEHPVDPSTGKTLPTITKDKKE